MTLDWHLIAEIGVPVLCLVLGGYVNRWFENRPLLTTYYGHVSSFQYTPPNGKKADIYTHSIILRNGGRKSATNVRIRHFSLPDFQIYPAVEFSVVDLADGTKEILIPRLIPNEQLTISYLYFPPLTYSGVNADIRSDDGFAKQIPVLIQRQYPAWFNRMALLVMLIGLVTIAYFGVAAVRRVLP